MVMSAVSSVSTPGVLVTVMPRSTAAATSILSTPLPKFAISLSCSPALPSTASSMRSVTVGTSTSAVLHRLDQLGLRHRLVVGIEPRVEQLAHADFDTVRQLARHHDERLFRSRHRVAPACCIRHRRADWCGNPASPRDFPRPVQVSLTGVLRHCTPHFRGRAGCDLGLSATDGRGKTSSHAGHNDVRCVTSRWRAGFVRLLAVSALDGVGAAGARPTRNSPAGPSSGLPVPRFVSLKPDKVNVRGRPDARPTT